MYCLVLQVWPEKSIIGSVVAPRQSAQSSVCVCLCVCARLCVGGGGGRVVLSLSLRSTRRYIIHEVGFLRPEP